MKYNFDRSKINQMNKAISGDAVTLPFSTLILHWRNGSPAYANAGGALYFGGWQASEETYTEIEAMTNGNIRLGYESHQLINQEGKDYTAFLTRHVIVSLIGKRKRWIKNSEYDAGRSHVQYLALLGDFDNKNKQYSSTGIPAMLTAKGFAAMYLENSFADFEKATISVRREFADSLPFIMFWIPVGTYGAEPEIIKVGKNQKSPITPCKVILPKAIDQAYIERSVITQPDFDMKLSLQEQAEDWLKAWDDIEAIAPQPVEPEFHYHDNEVHEVTNDETEFPF